MIERSLGKGVIGIEEIDLYTVPNKIQTQTTLLTFVNTSAGSVTINIYKKIAGVNYQISPVNMIFPAGYMAQEDGAITLSANDSIVGTCSVEGAVQFTINGMEEAIQ